MNLKELQEDICRNTFNNLRFWKEQYDKLLFSKNTSYKEKKEALNIYNKAIKEHLIACKELKDLKEIYE